MSTARLFEPPALSLVGKLAAAMAHELRNPICSARGILELAGMKEEGECVWFRQYSPMVIAELDRASEMLRGFLSLAADKPVYKAWHNLNSILEALLPLLKTEAAAAGIEIETDLRPVPDLLVDDEEMRQLVLNLARNGLEAIPSGGRIAVKTYLEDQTVVLAVKDEGIGMTDDVVKQLGTPFFSTKEVGSGLGLSLCLAIARRHGAEVLVDTGIRGTTFFVRFKAPVRKPLRLREAPASCGRCGLRDRL